MRWRNDPEDDGDTRDREDTGGVRLDADDRDEAREEREADTGERTAEMSAEESAEMSAEEESAEEESAEEESTDVETGAAAPMDSPPRTAAEIAAGARSPEDRDATDADVTDVDRDTAAEQDAVTVDDTEAGTEADVDVQAEPERQSLVGEAAVGTGEDLAERLIPADEAERMRGRWRDLQSGFVDDPHEAVVDAEKLVGEAMATLTARYEEQVSAVAGMWHDGDGAHDTEKLRVALRSYRRIFESVVPS
jgi:hypothetical protein